MPIVSSVADLIGRTPLVQLHRYACSQQLKARLLAKVEYLNPGGSVKDRAALSMLRDAELRGGLAPGGTIIEATSGNTGIALCMLAAARGYRAIIVMPDSMSRERRALIRAYGGSLVLTPAALGMQGAATAAQRLHAALPGSFLVSQFANPMNPASHAQTTGPEIWQDTEGQVDFFVAGVGTGGVLSGVGRYLKSQSPTIRIVAVEPAASPLLGGGIAAAHGIEGIGANFIPSILDRTLMDEVIPITESDARSAAQALAQQEGLLCGVSSGAALHAAALLAKRSENAGKTVVVLLPDSGERYLSSLEET